MDPVTLATSALALLTPYLAKAGENFAEDAGKKLWDTIMDKFKDRPAATGAASELAAKADDPDNQEAFALQLRKAFKEDPDFAKEIVELVNRASVGGVINAGSGAVVTVQSVSTGKVQVPGNIGRSMVIGNNNTISNTSSEGSKKSKSPEEKQKK